MTRLDTTGTHVLSAAAPATADAARPNVLLVDDQPARLLTYEAILEGVGVNCVRAQSGKEALERLLKQPFAAILLDADMPEMDGFETARIIREHPLCARTPIIFMTAVHLNQLEMLRGYEVGAIDYIPVPVVPEILRSKVALLVELDRRRTELEALSKGRAEKEWLAAVLNSMNEEVYFTDTQKRYMYANPAALREFGHAAVEGIDVEKIVSGLEVLRADGSVRPIDEAPPLRALRGEVVSDEEQIVRIPRTGEQRHRQVSSAPVRDASGNIIGSVSVARDITEQRRIENMRRAREVRSNALLQLGDQLRSLTEPADLAFAAARILGESLGVSRCGYGTIDINSETVTIERDWHAPGMESIAGVLRLREYGTYFDELKRGETVVCTSTVTDPRTRVRAAALAAIHVRSFVNMAVTEQGGAVAMLWLSHHLPRSWSDEDLAFIREVAQRTRIAVERRRNEIVVAADLRDTRLLRDLAARVVAEGGDTPALFDDILGAAMTIAGADAGTIQLLDEGTQELQLVATRGIERGVTQLVERVDTPLISRSGRALGMFSTHWRKRRVLSEREERFLDLLARQTADLIERTRAEQQLRAADRRKDEFLAMLAHELRNPLVPIRTGIELLKSARAQPTIVDSIRPMMERQIGHVVRLIDDLLDVSRITSGKIELRRQPTTLSTVIGSAIEANRDAISASDLDLTVNIAEPHLVINVDPTRFAQVLSNLLQNAAKFTPMGGRIVLSAAVDAAELVITVADSGEGISPAMLPRVFDLFTQPDDKSQRRQAGLGIGLALARRLVEMHGGTIKAESEGVGRGSQFTVRIPAPRGVQRPQSVGRPGRLSLAGIRVLIVDDNRDGADSMALLLESMGSTVRVAYDGLAGLAEVSEFLPDVVLLDIGMPVMDGYETCRQIRKLSLNLRPAVVALTGWGQEQDKKAARQAGFDAHLTKPADPAKLEDTIRTLSQGARQ
jgi:PAS domain S-box-containing protein